MADAFPSFEEEITCKYASVASVLKLPPMTTGVPKSARFIVNSINNTDKMPGRTIGRITFHSVSVVVAPRSLEAKISLRSRWSKEVDSISVAKEILPMT